MEVPTFQNRACRRENPHGKEGESERQLGERILRRHFVENADVELREVTYKKDVSDEDHEVEQQSAIGFGEEIDEEVVGDAARS